MNRLVIVWAEYYATINMPIRIMYFTHHGELLFLVQ
jgi:hypothetical protein